MTRPLTALRRASIPIALGMLLVACGGRSQSENGTAEMKLVAGSGNAFTGLLNPVDLTVDARGRVLVLDAGDRTVKIFDRVGRFEASFGRAGRGPGELTSVQDIAVAGSHIVVLDPSQGRLVVFDSTGGEARRVEIPNSEQLIASLGSNRILLADSPAWTLPPGGGRGTWPLFEIGSPEGRIVRDMGTRSDAGNPFVDNIVNFVLPAGTADGHHVWLAYLNDPRVDLYTMTGDSTTVTSIERRISFQWARIPPNFIPDSKFLAKGPRAIPPFDALALSIATDSANRAYILTPLSSIRSADGRADSVAIDVVEVASRRVRRMRVAAPATDLAVAPDGALIYLLDEGTATIRAYRPAVTHAR